MKMKIVLFCLLAVGWGSLSSGRTLRLVAPLPMDGLVGREYSPVSGGHTTEPTCAKDVSGTTLYAFNETSAGMITSEKGGNLNVGDSLAPPEGMSVDWQKMVADFTNQAAFTEGYVFYTGSTNEADRLVVGRFGTFSMVWQAVVGGKTVPITNNYETGVAQTVVPHRLFWTSAPFNGPGVAMSQNYGMKLFGDPSLFMDESNTNAYGVLNMEYGVYYDRENNMCVAYARELADGSWEGPKGEFVVAYYDTGACEHYLGCTVVEVTGPDAVYLTACVGDELRPQNENYDPTSGQYMPLIQSMENDTDDERAPYVYLQEALDGLYHAKENRVYGISETLPGEVGAKKAEVYWEATDDFDVYWPFEQTCYHLKWPECPTVVLGNNPSEKGPGITLPSCYTPSLLDWREPKDVAAVSGTEISLNKPGHFTLKLTNADNDNFWLVPLNVAYPDDDTKFPAAAAVEWPVGSELRPQVIQAVTDAKGAEILKGVDAEMAGYIYEPNSRGQNWNEELYHFDAEGQGNGESEDFSGLKSAVYLVNVVEDTGYDAEVWWMSSYLRDDMPEKITFPVLPQHYKAAWPAPEAAMPIVYASGMGSAAGGLVSSGCSLYLPSAKSCASVNCTLSSYATSEATFSLWLNPSPAAAAAYGTVRTAGDVVSFELGSDKMGVSIVEPAQEGRAARCRIEGSLLGACELSLPDNHWTSLTLAISTNRVEVYADGVKLTEREIADWVPNVAQESKIQIGGEGSAAAGVAVDGIMVWDSTTQQNEKTAVLKVDFASAFEVADGVVYAKDSQSLKYLSGENLALVRPGRPAWNDGRLYASGGVEPKVYVQNDSDAIGYNPNEEHAIAIDEKDGYSVFALRTDMNDDKHPPYVLAQYNDNGKGAMQLYRVSVTNATYRWPVLNSTAGNRIAIFHPFDAMPKGKCTASEVAAEDAKYDAMATYRDRTGMYWARRDGEFNHYIRYFGEPGFVCTAGRPDERDLEGAVLPAMKLENAYVWPEQEKVELVGDDSNAEEQRSREGLASASVGGLANASEEGLASASEGVERGEVDRDFICNMKAGAIRQVASWPDPKSFYQMSIAQVLTRSENGLPDVYNMKTCAITYPYYGYKDDDPNSQRVGDNLYLATNRVVKLIDPTVRKEAEIPVSSSFVQEYGFTEGDEGNVVNRQGYYYFNGLPPVIADRLYVDINSAGAGKAHLVFEGDYHDSDAGVSYLRVNSMSAGDRDAVLAVFDKAAEGGGSSIVANIEKLKAALLDIYQRGDSQPSRQIGRYQYVETNSVGGVAVAQVFDVVSNDYAAADHYALVATGEGNEWVTLIENDGPGAENLPVTMHTIYVGTNLYSGKIVALSDANNVLSEQLSLLFTAPLGKAADAFEFEWFFGDSPSDGHVPSVPSTPSPTPGAGYPGGDSAWREEAASQSANGAYYIDAVKNANTGSISMKDLVNRYWTMHYRATNNTAAARLTGGRWSAWCDPMLAEGWVQRVLNAITPFSQRLADLYNNKAELKFTMPAQIGAPWKGDVALNNENLNRVGLEQLYRTILNRAEAMSIAQGEGTTTDDTNDAVNEQLVEATARLADMQMTLGAEAYSDAKNPLIASNDGSEHSGAVFCFANQVPTLLDEELALLRGRTAAVSPSVKEYPFYNRLMWNFTKGVTQGEVAYVNNYNIGGDVKWLNGEMVKSGEGGGGKIDAEAAAKMYPQGHGDAYGYYLSTVKSYYRLLRNPNFWWGKPAMMSMVVADHVVNMDYQEEDKFAEAAYNVAKIGAEVVGLTARKQWRGEVKWLNGEMVKSGGDVKWLNGEMVKSGGDVRSGYFDDPAVGLKVGEVALPQAFGYGEWGCRAGYGAFVNWAVANSLLPQSEATATKYFKDQSIATVTRATSASLSPLGAMVGTVENTVNSVDSGLNPLGLSANTIPFDISPSEFAGVEGKGAKSHYEQIRERVQSALDNAKTVLDYANVYGSRLRSIENEQFNTEADADEMEASYDKQLIAIYGRPFTDDVGAGKTYAQGYVGPDLYHYMYMDLSEYGLSEVAVYTNAINIGAFDSAAMLKLLNGKAVSQSGSIGSAQEITLDDFKSLLKGADDLFQLNFTLTADGLVAKPATWTGKRPCEGTLQAAYRKFLTAYIAFKNAYDNFATANGALQAAANTAYMSQSQSWKLYSGLMEVYSNQQAYQWSMMGLTLSTQVLGWFAEAAAKGVSFQNVALGGNKIVGTANSLPFGDMMRAIVGGGSGVAWTICSSSKTALDMSSKILNTMYMIEMINSSMLTQDNTYYSRSSQSLSSMMTSWSSAYSAAQTLQSAQAELQAAQQDFRTILEEANQLLEERYRARVRLANQATARRYQDMYARVARNNALSKFSTAFDVAQRYVFELAKVYSYEIGEVKWLNGEMVKSGGDVKWLNGEMVKSGEGGGAFADAAIGTRALGDQGLVTDNSVTDGGLWDIVNRMDANFAQLKGRLGINNPDVSTKWFSLRYSHFRIDPGAAGDAAWRQELQKHWVDDILTYRGFSRYCEPPQRSVKAAKESGFVFEFSTCVNFAENFFGRPLLGGETTYSSSDYAVKLYAIGLDFVGYEGLAEAGKVSSEPNVYLVPIGRDYMRAPLSTSRQTISFSVVDQILPLPYPASEADVAEPEWLATFNGLDGTTDSAAKIRRHSTLRVDGTANSRRLVSRSVWNDRWLLVIPAAEILNNVEQAKKNFEGVADIKIGIKAYARSGN